MFLQKPFLDFTDFLWKLEKHFHGLIHSFFLYVLTYMYGRFIELLLRTKMQFIFVFRDSNYKLNKTILFVFQDLIFFEKLKQQLSKLS